MTDTKKFSKKKKIIITATTLTVAGIVTTLAIVFSGPKAPDPTKLEPKTAIKYAASQQFSQLPEKEQESYFEKMFKANRGQRKGRRHFMRNTNLSKEEHARLRKNIGKYFRKHMKERMNKFFAMSQAERDKELDRIAERIKQRRQQRTASGNSGQRGRGRGGRGRSKARQKNFLESVDSDSRAQMVEFRKQLRSRLQK